MSKELKEVDFQFENFEKYVGTKDEVKKDLSFCKHCKHELLFSHLPDYTNLTLKESTLCTNCGKDHTKIIHILN